MRELIKGGSLMCTGGSQKRIDGPHSVKYSGHMKKETVMLDMYTNQGEFHITGKETENEEILQSYC